MKTYAEIMNKLSRRAREYGVYIAQENVVRFKCGYIENLKEFVRYADEDIMFTLDVKQSFRAQQDIWEIMSLMGKRISHLHISDYEGDRDSLLPGRGCFDFQELFENLTQRESGQRVITVRDMELNMNNRSVSVGGKEVNLTAKEFDLLQLFVTNRGKVFSRESLLETIWKYDYLGDLRTVDVHIRRLREKIERVPSQPEYIFTKWGVGYYFTDKD